MFNFYAIFTLTFRSLCRKNKMRLLILTTILILNTVALAQNPNNWDTAWVSSFGGPSIEVARDIKETSDKGFIIAGNTSSFGNGNSSFYIVKTDSLGFYQWSKSIGTSNNDVAYSVEISTDGGYFISGFSNWNIQNGYDGFVVKTDNQGNVIWTKNYGGNDWDFIYNSCLMPDGGLLLCGETNNGENLTDAYLIRTNSVGDTLWTKKMGAAGKDCYYNVKQYNNRIYVIGKKFNTTINKTDASIYKLDLNGNILNQDFFRGNNTDDFEYLDFYFTTTGDILLTGKRQDTLNYHYAIRKIDTLNFNQINYSTSSQNFYFNSITEGNNNDVYTLGNNVGGAGGKSALYFRLNSGLFYINSANFGGIKDEQGTKIIKTSKGYAFVGSTNSYGNQNNSIDDNFYLVVFNKKDLVNDYFLLINQYIDNLPMVNVKENKINLLPTAVFPNPIAEEFTICISENIYNGQQISYKLYNSLGALVQSEEEIIADNILKIKRKSLKAGTYNYSLKMNATFIGSGKLIVE